MGLKKSLVEVVYNDRNYNDLLTRMNNAFESKGIRASRIIKPEYFAFMEADGSIDLDSISDCEDGVKLRVLENSMGWRFQHPERYNQDEAWENLLEFGKIVNVSVVYLKSFT